MDLLIRILCQCLKIDYRFSKLHSITYHWVSWVPTKNAREKSGTHMTTYPATNIFFSFYSSLSQPLMPKMNPSHWSGLVHEPSQGNFFTTFFLLNNFTHKKNTTVLQMMAQIYTFTYAI